MISKMFFRKMLFAFAGFIAVALLALATPQGEVSAAEPIKVRIAWQPGVNLYFFVARAEGLYEKAGLEPEYLRFNAGPPMFAALRTGDVDTAYMGAPPAVVILSQEPTVKAFFTGSDESNAESLIVRADAGIDNLADLEGKTIGVWRGTSADFALRRALETVGLSGSDLTILDLDVTAIIPAFEKKEVDGIWVWDPWALRLQKLGGKRLVSDADVGVRMPDPYLARVEWLKNPEGAVRMLEATQMASEIIRNDKSRAATIMAQALEMKIEDAEEVIDRLYYPTVEEQAKPSHPLSLHPDAVAKNEGLVGALTEIAEFLHGKGRIETVPNMAERVDSTPLMLVTGM